MLQAQGTTADAVLCFAVHYDCRQPSQSCLGTGALSQLSCVSRHCLAALRQQIAPSLFAQCPQFYDQARTAEHFLALMRFNQLCRQDSALWSHSFVQGLKRFYLDAPALCRVSPATGRAAQSGTPEERALQRALWAV